MGKKFKLLPILVLASVVSFAGCKKDNNYTLNITLTNGTVEKNPNLTAYNSGVLVQLTTTPNSGYTFTSWSGDVTDFRNPLPDPLMRIKISRQTLVSTTQRCSKHS